jgi:hypothetical protein
MAKPVEIQLVANAKDFNKGVRDAGSTLDDFSDALDDVVRDGDDAGDKLGRSFDDAADKIKTLGDAADTAGDDLGDEIGRGAKDAESKLDALETKFKTVADASKRESSSAGSDLGTNFKAGAERAEEGMDEVKESARSNAIEVAASFDGSAESIADGFQGLAAEMFAGFGPAGIVAGLAVAAGIGLASQAFADSGEDAAELQEHIAEIADEFISTGRIGETSLQYIIDGLHDLATETEDGKKSLSDLYDLVKDSGQSSFDDLAQAYAGNVDGLDALIKKQEEHRDALVDQQNEQYIANAGYQSAKTDIDRQVDAQDDLIDRLHGAKKAATDAAKEAEAYAAAGGPELERKAKLIEGVNDAYDDAAGAADDYMDAESGIFDVSAYISAMQKRAKALADYQETLQKSALTPEAKAFLEDQGAEAAAQFLAGYKDATPEQKRELNRIWTEAGRENSGEYTAALKKGIPNKIDGPSVRVNVNTSEAQAQLDRWMNKDHTLGVSIRVAERSGRTVR